MAIKGKSTRLVAEDARWMAGNGKMGLRGGGSIGMKEVWNRLVLNYPTPFNQEEEFALLRW